MAPRLLFVTILSLFQALLAHDPKLATQGVPTFVGKELPRESFVPVQTQRLNHPRLVWFNRKYLREQLGFNVPDSGPIPPEVEKWVLEEFGWGIPSLDEPASAFSSETRNFYADLYGGGRIGGNWGSGRAASAGDFQIKGIGKTPLVSTAAGPRHSNGTLILSEAIREAIWGEVLNEDLPLGSNRVVAIIDRGTLASPTEGALQINAMVIREDPLRPAHYMFANGHGPFKSTDKKRTDAAIEQLLHHWKIDPNWEWSELIGPLQEKLQEYASDMGRQFGAAWVRRFYQGAITPSNIDLRAKFLDYGNLTLTPDHGPLQLLRREPFGNIKDIQLEVLDGFINNLLYSLDAPMQSGGMLERAVKKHFMTAYQSTVKKELLLLTGIPFDLIDSLADTDEAKTLASSLEKLGRIRKESVKAPVSGTVDIKNRLGIRLQELAKEASKKIPLFSKDKISKAYFDFLKKAESQALERGMSLVNFRSQVLERCRHLNRDLPQLFRWQMVGEDMEMVKRYFFSHDPSEIARSIDDRIQSSLRYSTSPTPSIAKNPRACLGIALTY